MASMPDPPEASFLYKKYIFGKMNIRCTELAIFQVKWAKNGIIFWKKQRESQPLVKKTRNITLMLQMGKQC